MREVTITAERRDDALKGSASSRRLRREGRVPAIVYGLDTEPDAVTVSAHEMLNVMHRVGVNALINLTFGDTAQLTMAREVQRHPVRGDLVHIDFVRIREDVPVQAEVTVQLVGDPVGLKEGGVLEHVAFTVTVSARPRALPESIEVDVSDLNVGEQKRLSDLAVPEGVELVGDPELVVANLVVPRLEEEGRTLSAEEVAELEGLSEEELEALKDLAGAAEGGEEGEAGADEDAEGGDADEGEASSEEG